MLSFLLVCTLLALGEAEGGPDVGALEARIVNGVDAPIETFPYVASIEIDGEHACGGVILTPNRVLTVASCIQEKPISSIIVRVGNNRRGTGGKIVRITGYFLHPDFDSIIGDSDAAILILESTLLSNPTSQPLDLHPENTVITPENDCFAVGWGATNINNYFSDHLLAAPVAKVDDATCRSKSEFGHTFTERMTCHAKTHGSPCGGDNGSPLICNGLLYGIVVKADQICGQQSGLYTKIVHPKIYNFITNFI